MERSAHCRRSSQLSSTQWCLDLSLCRRRRRRRLPQGPLQRRLNTMALKRLDEEFELKPGTQLLPYMKRLLPSLEARFQDLEGVDRELQAIADEIRAAALLRMNEILIPATEDIIAITKLGFLLAPVTEVLYTIQLGYMAVYVDDGPQAKTFTPSPYIIIEGIDDPNN